MKSPFRIAIVGAGMVTANCHLPAALATNRIQVVALVDSVIDRAYELVKRFNINAHVLHDVEPVLNLVDGIVITTPNNSHCETALTCLQNGIPILIEKPLASTLADAERICKSSSQHGIPVSVGYCRRFWDNVQLMTDLIKSEYFGCIKRFVYQSGNAGGWASMSGFHLDRKSIGGGVLMTMGTHFLDLMLLWFGYPSEFEFSDDSLGGPEANAIATFKFKSDISSFEGTIRLSRTIDLPNGFVMETDNGFIVLHEGENAPILFRPKRRPDVEAVVRRKIYIEASPRNGFLLQLEDFAQSCLEGREPAAPCRDGLESLKLVESLYASKSLLRRDWYDLKEEGDLL